RIFHFFISGRKWLYVTFNLSGFFVACRAQSTVRLEPSSHFGGGSEKAGQTQGGISRHSSLFLDDFVNASGGTRRDRAREFCDSPRSFINSSRRISPG